MKLSFNQLLSGAFCIAILLLAVLGYQSLRGISELIQNTRWVEHTQTVIDRMQALLTEVEEESRSVRGLLLTNDPTYLKSYQEAKGVMPHELLELERLTSDNSVRQVELARLKGLLDQHANLMEGLSQTHGPSQQPAIVQEVEQSNQVTEQIKAQVTSMQVDERRLLQDRTDRVVTSSQVVREIVATGTVCGTALMLLATLLLQREASARSRVEETLRQSEERTRLMIENIKDYAILMLDPGGRIVTWNAGAERIGGYRAEEVIGQSCARFYPEEKIRLGIPEAELKLAAEKGRFENEDMRFRKDGTLFLASVVITPVRDQGGQLLGFVKVIRDVTTRRQAEMRIQKLNQDLQLRAQQLELSNKELEAFTYSVSHDLRAPLRHIHGFVELLQQSSALQGETESRHRMKVIANAAKQMGRLIDDLLAFSRTGRAQMHPMKFDQREIIDQVILELEPETQGRQVAWQIHPLVAVTGDPALLRLVWTNLLSNALKFTRSRDKAEIEIGNTLGQRPDSDCEEAVFYVRDNGVGFDMDYASKLFGVFQRLHRPEDFEGTGIGLANVQRIILRHGGRVWAESKVDSGATFYFALPLT